MPIIKRIVAFFLDMILIGFIMVAFSMSPLNVNYDKQLNLENKYAEDVEKLNDFYKDKVEEDEEEAKKYLKEYKSLSVDYIYSHNKLSIIESIVQIVLMLLYFVLLPYFMDGQTLGKRIMKVRIVGLDEKKVNILNLLLRTILLYGIIFNIISLLALAFLNKSTFVVVYTIISYIAWGFDLAILFTMLIRDDKRGLHDLIAKTKVEGV